MGNQTLALLDSPPAAGVPLHLERMQTLQSGCEVMRACFGAGGGAGGGLGGAGSVICSVWR